MFNTVCLRLIKEETSLCISYMVSISFFCLLNLQISAKLPRNVETNLFLSLKFKNRPSVFSERFPRILIQRNDFW